ncbi:MAG: DUF3137 domain-containing protein, partial [Candidatus Altiarchaeota archaeon]|nr:DUF3137 domain-containing protein [Candidatus Altiarchaeota archaeon]
MKTIEDIRLYYESELRQKIRPLEDRRKLILAALIILSVSLITFILLPSIYLALSGPRMSAAPLIAIIFCFLLITGAYGLLSYVYVPKFKKTLIQDIVAFFGPEFEYSPKYYMPLEYFKDSGIFPKVPDRYSGEDYISGTVGKTKIEFSEIHAEYKSETTNAKGRKEYSYYTLFKGIFISADFNKNFTGRTLVLPDTAQRMFGGLLGTALQSRNTSRGKLIKLEDPEFERYFVVYGDDQVQARYILTPGLMSRITEFRKKTGTNVFLSFVNNKVMLALPRSENIFEPRLFRTLLDVRQVEGYYKQIELIAGIVEDLN